MMTPEAYYSTDAFRTLNVFEQADILGQYNKKEGVPIIFLSPAENEEYSTLFAKKMTKKLQNL